MAITQTPNEVRAHLTHVDMKAQSLIYDMLIDWRDDAQRDLTFDIDAAALVVAGHAEVRPADVRRLVSQVLSLLARDPARKIIRVGGSSSGKYRMVLDSESLRPLKNSQSVRKVGKTKAAAASASDAAPTPTPRRSSRQLVELGDKLTVLLVKGDTALLQCRDGEIYRAVFERVLL